MKSISVMQPWCWIIMNGDLLEKHGIPRKFIENRSWTTAYRGPILLRAGSYDSEFFEKKELSYDNTVYCWSRIIGDENAKKLYHLMFKEKSAYPSGGIVGQCNLTGVLDWRVSGRNWNWKVQSQYGLVLSDIKPLPFA